jgi:ubiquinone/menaquinone biosynthesis C-methylase UbiE
MKSMHESQARWDAAAEHYRVSGWHSNEAALAHLVEMAEPHGGSALDIATGAGHAALAIAPYVDTVTAIDTSERMLEVTSDEAGKRGLTNVEVLPADALALPFENNHFDLVICRTAAHHFADPDKFLSECHRVLRSGKKFVLIDTTGSDDPTADELVDRFERLRDPSHVRNYTKESWRKMAGRAGFSLDREETVSKPLNAKQWMERAAATPDVQKVLLDMIARSSGWFRQYLSPHGESDLLTFHLDETTFVFVKP